MPTLATRTLTVVGMMFGEVDLVIIIAAGLATLVLVETPALRKSMTSLGGRVASQALMPNIPQGDISVIPGRSRSVHRNR